MPGPNLFFLMWTTHSVLIVYCGLNTNTFKKNLIAHICDLIFELLPKEGAVRYAQPKILLHAQSKIFICAFLQAKHKQLRL